MKDFIAGRYVQQGYFKRIQPNLINRPWLIEDMSPLINAAKVGEVADVSAASAYKLIQDLENFGILREITGPKRGKLYFFSDSINLFK